MIAIGQRLCEKRINYKMLGINVAFSRQALFFQQTLIFSHSVLSLLNYL